MHLLLSHRRSLSAKLFLAIAYNDIVTSIFGAVPFAIPRLDTALPGIYGVPVLCNVCGVLLNVTERYGVFLIAVLSVTRAIALKYPFLRLSQPRILALMVVYLVVQLGLSCLPFFRGTSYYYDEVYTVCTWTLEQIMEFRTEGWAYFVYQLTYHLLLFIPFFLPSFFVVSSCVFCVLSLRVTVINNNNKNKAKASGTIILFTVTYIILHVPIWIFLVLFLVTEHGQISVDFSSKLPLYLFIFSSKVSVFLNAAVNPIIYMARTNSMKNSFKEDVRSATFRLSHVKKSIQKRSIKRGNGENGETSPAMSEGRVYDQEQALMPIAISRGL